MNRDERHCEDMMGTTRLNPPCRKTLASIAHCDDHRADQRHRHQGARLCGSMVRGKWHPGGVVGGTVAVAPAANAE